MKKIGELGDSADHHARKMYTAEPWRRGEMGLFILIVDTVERLGWVYSKKKKSL